MSDRVPMSTPPTATNFVYPLSEFYSRAKLPLPRIEAIPAEALPESLRPLLVHNNDLTLMLETFHKSRIHLEIVSRDRRGGFYFRETVLRLDHDEKPVEFGANKIFLGFFPEEAQELILLEQVPLGRILKDCGMRHQTEARLFLLVEPDELITRVLELENPPPLYGRKTVVTDLKGRPLSEIVEILPPVVSA